MELRSHFLLRCVWPESNCDDDGDSGHFGGSMLKGDLCWLTRGKVSALVIDPIWPALSWRKESKSNKKGGTGRTSGYKQNKQQRSRQGAVHVLVCFYATLLEHEHSISYQYIVRLEGMASGELDDIWGEILLKLFLMRGFFLRQACSSHYLIVLLLHYLSTKKTWTNSETAMLSIFSGRSDSCLWAVWRKAMILTYGEMVPLWLPQSAPNSNLICATSKSARSCQIIMSCI